MQSLRILSLAVSLSLSAVGSALAAEPPSAKQTEASQKCEHGVRKTLCTRCNPKLVPIFKAKKDWCEEHQRPESQCVLCNSELARQGVK